MFLSGRGGEDMGTGTGAGTGTGTDSAARGGDETERTGEGPVRGELASQPT